MNDKFDLDGNIQKATSEVRERVKNYAKRMIWVRFQRSGFHFFPQAQTDINLKDVSYLGKKHRHLFKFKIGIEVFHNDRELEFHQVLNYCETLFEHNIDINSKSVEMLSDDLFDELAMKYPNRDIDIEVSEDGECGCSIRYSR